MSLMNYITNSSGSSTSSLLSTSGTSTTDALQQLLANTTDSDTAAALKAAIAKSNVSISNDATISAAAAADAKKDAVALAGDIRTALDKQYADDKNATPDFSEMSGRAVATVILNKDGKFSNEEVLAAKKEMRARDRNAFVNATSGGLTLDTLQAYQNTILASRSSMSAEEKELRARHG